MIIRGRHASARASITSGPRGLDRSHRGLQLNTLAAATLLIRAAQLTARCRPARPAKSHAGNRGIFDPAVMGGTPHKKTTHPLRKGVRRLWFSLYWVEARSGEVARRMTAPNPGTNPYDFILEHIDSVPHLEALVLLWNSRPVGWTCEELASRLYVPSDKTAQVLRDLVRMQLIAESPGPPPKYSYVAKSEEQNELLASLDNAWRKDLVRISTMIHSKASSGVREFARAFQFKQEKK